MKDIVCFVLTYILLFIGIFTGAGIFIFWPLAFYCYKKTGYEWYIFFLPFLLFFH